MVNARKVFSSSTKLVLTQGVHEVKIKSFIAIRHAKHVCITGTNHVEFQSVNISYTTLQWTQPESVIQCSRSARFGFLFQNVSDLTISKITITGCGGWLDITPLQNILGPSIVGTLFLANVRDVYMDTVSVQETLPGFGLVAINILGNSTIKHCSFLFNNKVALQYLALNPRPLGGNALFVFTDSADCGQSNYPHNLSIITTMFISGLKESVPIDKSYWHPPALRGGPGLSIVIASCILNLNITVNDIVAAFNMAMQSSGVNLWISMFMAARNVSIKIMQAKLFNALPITRDLATVGITYNLKIPQDNISHTSICDCMASLSNGSKITLSDVDVSKNAGLGILVEEDSISSYRRHLLHSLSIDQCTVSDNSGDYARAIGMFVVQQGAETHVKIEVRKCIFHGNKATLQDKTTVLALSSAMALNNCVFSNNLNTALHITGHSAITLEGNITFCSNTGWYGGAILIDGHQSFVFLKPHTHIQFIGNTALVTGGVIHVSSRQESEIPDSDTTVFCFIQIDCVGTEFCSQVTFTNLTQVQSSLDLQMWFVNNTAGKAGSAIWGGSVEDCVLVHSQEYGYESQLVDMFQIEHHWSDHSYIASSPEHICYCSKKVLCTSESVSKLLLDSETITTFPGQVVSVSIGVIGQLNGYAPALIQAKTYPQSEVVLGQLQETQRIAEAKCTMLSFTMYTYMSPYSVLYEGMLELSIAFNGLDYPLDYFERTIPRDSINISITFMKCPVGFQHSPVSRSCACLQPLFKYIRNVSCDINTQTIWKATTVWINASYTTNDTQALAVHQHCPFDYCNPSKHRIDLRNPDQQCDHNRSGILCGSCKTGLSLTLGSLRCTKCS